MRFAFLSAAPLASLTITFILGAFAAPASAAEPPPKLWQTCDSSAPAGQRCQAPSGVAANPDNGHLYLVDGGNHRVDEFTPLGEFLAAWGWDVVASGPDDTASGEFEVCLPESGDECKAGVQGISGVGQFDEPTGVAVDSAGNVYIADIRANRVQKFNPKGEFGLMFGSQVNKTKVAQRETEEAASEPVTVTEEEENLCPFDPGDECGAGVAGTGPGQFHWSDTFFGDYIAAGPANMIYVGDQERIERFDGTGVFQDECSVQGRVQSLDADSAGNLYAIYAFQPDVRRLTYAAGAECEEVGRFEIPEPDEFTHPIPTAATVDSAGDVYAFGWPASRNGSVPIDRIYEFDPTGNLIDQFGKEEFDTAFLDTAGMTTAACAPGDLFVSNLDLFDARAEGPFLRTYGSEPDACFAALTLAAEPVGETTATLRGTINPGGQLTTDCRFEYGPTSAYGAEAPCAESPGSIGAGEAPVPVHADISGLEGATAYHVRIRATIGGVAEIGPDRTFKTKGPPLISDGHVLSAVYGEADLSAQINPEGLPTACQVEFGPSAAYGSQSPAREVGEDRSEHSLTVRLTGLTPGSAYHWRFVCNNTALLNGGLTEGEDRTLSTYRTPQPPAPCPNDALRTGASASLPDCRAYEMVSPVDKNGADIVSGYPTVGSYGGYVQVTPDGERLTYAAKFPAFAGPSNSFTFNQYLASRGDDGSWSTESLDQPYDGHALENAKNHTFAGSHREFMAFTPDLCSAWLVDLQTPPLEPDGQENAANLYRRESCGAGAGSFETLTSSLVGLGESDPRRVGYVDQFSVEGVADDGSQAIFRAKAQLIKEAAVGGQAQLYDRSASGLHLVSVLPGGAADASATAVGSGWGQNFPSNLQGAVSSNGSLVYWTSGIKDDGEGKLYLRRHPEQGIVSGECSKPSKACTIAVSPGSQAFFWQGATDGSAALYSEGEDLYRFDLATESRQLIAEEVLGVAGASEDLSRVYLVSREALGAGASVGQPNLYLEEGGSFVFIATLAEGDVGAIEPGALNPAYEVAARNSFLRGTRVTPDGSSIVFESRARPGAYDNTAESGKAAVEVYAYRAGRQLHCVSCNPSGARPASRELPEPYRHQWEGNTNGHVATNVEAAAWFPTWEVPLHASNVLAADGSRLFFNSNDALLPTDTNGAQDVYEWEAPEHGTCTEQSSAYFPQNGGCLYLISSGESSFESEFWEASPDGENVFFNTASSLVPRDPGSIDLYDARVDGGFPEPTPAAACEGEACQSPPAPPNDATPASSAFRGAGNVREGAKKKRCAKGKVRRHGKCVKKHHAKHHKKHHRRHHRRHAKRGRGSR